MGNRSQFSSHSVTADAVNLLEMYQIFRTAISEIAGVLGLVTVFVTQPMQKSGMAVAKQNGIGNTWGLEANKGEICKSKPHLQGQETRRLIFFSFFFSRVARSSTMDTCLRRRKNARLGSEHHRDNPRS